MASEEALYLLMTNQKKVRDGFKFIDLNTHEKISIEECYDIVEKDLEVLEILKNHLVYGPSDKYIMICVHKDDKDFNKVKGWLENG